MIEENVSIANVRRAKADEVTMHLWPWLFTLKLGILYATGTSNPEEPGSGRQRGVRLRQH